VNIKKQLNKTKYYCSKCDINMVPILKMGGLICSKCRIIIFYPYSVEYQKEFKETLERQKDETDS
jgi:ribosomal protein L37AE/L43A